MAAELVLTAETVEFDLRDIDTRLGVMGRQQLRRLGGSCPPLREEPTHAPVVTWTGPGGLRAAPRLGSPAVSIEAMLTRHSRSHWGKVWLTGVPTP